jgi:hypothetical protein
MNAAFSFRHQILIAFALLCRTRLIHGENLRLFVVTA